MTGCQVRSISQPSDAQRKVGTLGIDACVVVVVVVVFLSRLRTRSCYIDTTRKPIGKGALDGKELFAIEGSENWRSTPGQPGGARKMRKPRKRTFTAATNRHC